MKPLLFTLSIPGMDDMPIYPFFFTIAVGALLAAIWLYYLCKSAGLERVVAIDMAIIAIVFSVIGSRAFHIVFEYPCYYMEEPSRVWEFLKGGFVSLGAYVFSFMAGTIYFRIRKMDALPYLDRAALTMPLIIFFVRLGCLLAGCCYGKPTDFFFSLSFPQGSTAFYFMGDQPLHAVQIYKMVNTLGMAGVLWWVTKYRQFAGQVLASAFIYLGVTRFFLEYLRGDEDRGVYFDAVLPGGISTGQIVMLIACAIGGGIYYYGLKQRDAAPDGKTASITPMVIASVALIVFMGAFMMWKCAGGE